MRKRIRIIVITLLLAGGAVLCVVRWQAWFGTPPERYWTGEKSNYSFPMFNDSIADSDSVLTVLVLGDIHNRLQRADFDTLAARVPHIDVVAQTGDWMDRGQNYYYQFMMREWTHSALYGVPVIACPGNHEYSKGLHKTLSPIWEKAFLHPHNGPADVPGASYYVDMPFTRFIIIDTNPLVRLVWLTRTLTWLRATMNTAGDRYIIVMMHHPVLPVSKGRFNALIYATLRHALGDADLVLAGHDHSYMRRTPFVVVNTAGKPKQQRLHYTPDAADSIPVYGVLQSSISNLQFNVYRLDDATLIDSLYVKHD